MDTAAWPAMVDELLDAIARLRGVLDDRPEGAALSTTERRDLERALDDYLNAVEAVAERVETIVRGSSGRPRR